MPYSFHRNVSEAPPSEDTYGSTSVPADPSFAAVTNASFLVFDRERAQEILGANPRLDLVFKVDPVPHEGPVYVPRLNKLYVTQLQPGFLPQLVIDLDKSPPTLLKQTADPPLYDATGAFYRDGLVYYSALGGAIINGQEFRPGIYTLNPVTGRSTPILNNYFGYFFNGCDDLAVDSQGDIWFTDNRELLANEFLLCLWLRPPPTPTPLFPDHP
jgi:sugar lactone lactonase YvrE